MKRKTKIIVSVSGIIIVMLALIGLTYAYFLTRINGNTNDKSISVSTANLELTYSDNSSEILGNGKVLMPSNEPIGTKTFTVTNNGGDTNYSVVLENMSITDAETNEETTFSYNDFVYTLTCRTKSGSSCANETVEQTELPLMSVALLNNDIAASDVHTYTLTIWFLEVGLDQSEDMGKTISAKLNIIDPIRENPYKANKESVAYNIINNAILQKNGTSLVSKPKTVPAKEMSLFGYKKQQEPTTFGGMIGSATNYYISYADDYTVNKDSGRFTLVNPKTVKYSESVSASDIAGKYAYWNTVEATARKTENRPTIYKITPNESDITSSTIKYAVIRASANEAKVSTEKELSVAPDDYGTSYYYRGGVEDNYLELNDICFRIVRIQGDGSIKLTLAKEGKCSSITDSDTMSAYIKDSTSNNLYAVYGYDEIDSKYYSNYEGYTGTDGLYKALNDWYNSKMSSVRDKLKNETWCIGENTNRYDKLTGALLTETSINSGWHYEIGKRLYGRSQAPEATYKCGSGADKVTGYVGTLLADEVAYAGGKAGTSNPTYYLRYNSEDDDYWLLSRSGFNLNSDEAFVAGEYGYLEFDAVRAYYAVRPAITLAAGVEISGGNGTKNNPYTLK